MLFNRDRFTLLMKRNNWVDIALGKEFILELLTKKFPIYLYRFPITLLKVQMESLIYIRTNIPYSNYH